MPTFHRVIAAKHLGAVRFGLAVQVTEPVMIGEGENVKPKMRIVVEDDEGRGIDLHAMRTTLGTQLARAGVTPQVAQRIMRHSDYRTTLKHYTVLGLVDTSAAMNRLPGVASERQVQAATGTTDSAPAAPQRFCQQLGRESERIGAASCDETTRVDDRPGNEKPQQSPGLSHDLAEFLRRAGEGIRTLNIQLGRLTLYH